MMNKKVVKNKVKRSGCGRVRRVNTGDKLQVGIALREEVCAFLNGISRG